MKNWNVILLMAFLAVLGVCVADSKENLLRQSLERRAEVIRLLNSANEQWVTKLVGSESNRLAIAAPTEVRVYQLRPQGSGPSPKQAREFPVSMGPVKLPSEDAKGLSDLLLGVNSYRWAYRSSCLIDYGVRLEFVGASNTVDVLVCLNCHVLTYQPGGSTENFGPIRGKLINTVSKALGLSENGADWDAKPGAPDPSRVAADADFTDREKLLWYSDTK